MSARRGGVMFSGMYWLAVAGAAVYTGYEYLHQSTAQPQPRVQPERQPRKLRQRRRRQSEQPYSAAIGPQLHPQHEQVNNKEGHKNEVN